MPTSTANFRDFYKPGLFVGVSRFIYFIESTKIRGRITQRSNSERRQKARSPQAGEAGNGARPCKGYG